jgi:hypothetical protein
VVTARPGTIPRFLRRALFRRRSAEKWKAVRTYNELHGLLWDYGLPASPGEFALGPLRRFFDLALEPGLSAGERCRILEHARLWAGRASATFLDPVAATTLAVGIQAELHRLAAMGSVGRWVVEVFEGDASHHAAPAFPDQT